MAVELIVRGGTVVSATGRRRADVAVAGGRIVAVEASLPATADALEVDASGILVLPDVLANAGGVVVSYFEWVQGLQEYFWKEEEVNAKLKEIADKAFEETWQVSQARNVSMRLAAYGLGVQRLADATRTRGLYP